MLGQMVQLPPTQLHFFQAKFQDDLLELKAVEMENSMVSIRNPIWIDLGAFSCLHWHKLIHGDKNNFMLIFSYHHTGRLVAKKIMRLILGIISPHIYLKSREYGILVGFSHF